MTIRHANLTKKSNIPDQVHELGLRFDAVTWPGYDIEGLNFNGHLLNAYPRVGGLLVRQDTDSEVTFFFHHEDGTTEIIGFPRDDRL